LTNSKNLNESDKKEIKAQERRQGTRKRISKNGSRVDLKQKKIKLEFSVLTAVCD